MPCNCYLGAVFGQWLLIKRSQGRVSIFVVSLGAICPLRCPIEISSAVVI